METDTENTGRQDLEAVAELLAWFKTTFAARTPPTSVLDSTPQYRVGWSEIRLKMKDLGLSIDVLADRLWWQKVFDAQLRRYCNKVLRAAGEKPLRKER
jgi:hypothetical protein